jgi:hypothetical protein
MKTGSCITAHEGFSIYEEVDNDGKQLRRANVQQRRCSQSVD